MRKTEFVESYFDAWNRCDPKGVADHLASGGVYCDIPENTQRSRTDLVESLDEFFAHYNHHHRYELIGQILSSETSIAFQYRVYPDSGDPAATIYRGAEFMNLHGDAAASINDYYEIPGAERTNQVSKLAAEKSLKYAKSGLSAELLKEYKNRLAILMQDDKIFLQSDLTLPKLAKAVNCSVNHLSQAINSGFGVSFFDYLSQYRIAHAKTLLQRIEDSSGAILNVAFSVGFNSNSAFYAAFKKCVGQTPAQYRRAQLRKSH